MIGITLDKMGKLLETYNLPKLNEEQSEDLNRLITPSNEAVKKKFSQQTETLHQRASQVKFTNHPEN